MPAEVRSSSFYWLHLYAQSQLSAQTLVSLVVANASDHTCDACRHHPHKRWQRHPEGDRCSAPSSKGAWLCLSDLALSDLPSECASLTRFTVTCSQSLSSAGRRTRRLETAQPLSSSSVCMVLHHILLTDKHVLPAPTATKTNVFTMFQHYWLSHTAAACHAWS